MQPRLRVTELLGPAPYGNRRYLYGGEALPTPRIQANLVSVLPPSLTFHTPLQASRMSGDRIAEREWQTRKLRIDPRLNAARWPVASVGDRGGSYRLEEYDTA